MTGLITVAQGLIACFWNRNEVRYDASRPEAAKFDPADKLNQPIIQSMVDGLGYDVAKGPIRVSEATAEDKAEWLKWLQTEYAVLKAAADRSTIDFGPLAAFEEIFKDEKGEFKVPQYVVGAGNRRWHALYYGAQRLLRDNTVPGATLASLGYNVSVPCIVRVYGTIGDRIMDQIDENETREIGVRNVEFSGNLKALDKGFKLGVINQQMTRNKFGATQGQKYWPFIVLNNRFPNLKLLERTIATQPNVGGPLGYIRWSDLSYTKLPNIATASNPNLPEEKRKDGKGNKLPLMTEEEVNDYFLNPKGEGDGKGRKPARMKDTDIQNMMDHPNPIVSAVASNILEPNPQKMMRVVEMTEGIQLLDRMFTNHRERYNEFVALGQKLVTASEASAVAFFASIAGFEWKSESAPTQDVENVTAPTALISNELVVEEQVPTEQASNATEVEAPEEPVGEKAQKARSGRRHR